MKKWVALVLTLVLSLCAVGAMAAAPEGYTASLSATEIQAGGNMPTVTVKNGDTVIQAGNGKKANYTVTLLGPSGTEVDGKKLNTSGEYTVLVESTANYASNNNGVTFSFELKFTVVEEAADSGEGLTVTLNPTSYTYDGTKKTPDVTVTDKNGKPVDADNYDVSYQDNTDAGTYTVTVTGNHGNINGKTASATFTIAPKLLNASMIKSIPAQNYTGSAIEPEVSLTDSAMPSGRQTLTADEDYTDVKYRNNINAGTAYVDVTGKGNYTGTATTTFTINYAPFNASLSQTEFIYDGGQKTPDVTVTVDGGETTLVENRDYTVIFNQDECCNAGDYSVTVTGTGNYAGSATLNFTILPKEITDSMVALSAASAEYTGSAQKPSVTVTDGNVTLTQDDCTVSYGEGDYTEAGTYTVTVTGKGNYTGTVEKTYTINTGNLHLTLSPESMEYTGSALKPAASVTGGNGAEVDASKYTISSMEGWIDAGEYTVTVTGSKNYKNETVSKTFTITRRKLTDAMVGSIAAQEYTGNAIMPDVTVEDGSTTLAKGTDYTVNYADNTAIGTATMTVTGKGNYSGTIERTFTIGKAPFNVTVEEVSYTYDGTEKKPGVTVTTKDGSKTLAEGTDYTVAYTNNVNAGTNTASVTVTGKGNYEGEVTKTFSIAPKQIIAEMVALSAASAVYNGDKQQPDVTVTDGSPLTENADYGVTYADGFVEVGTYTVTVTGKNNYTGTVTCEFTIQDPKHTVTVQIPDGGYVYDGTAKEPTVTVAGNGTAGVDYTVTYTNNVNAGTATVTVKGVKGSYKKLDYTQSFTIAKYTLTAANVALSASSVLYNGSEQKPTVSVSADKQLIEGVEYTLTFEGDFVNAGEYKVKVAAKADAEGFTNNYTGTVEKTFQIVKSETDIGTAENGQLRVEYTYGEEITAKVTAAPATRKLKLAAPAPQQMALYVKRADGTFEQITAGVDAVDGVYTLTYDTTAKLLALGEHELWAGYTGYANMEDAQKLLGTVKILPRELMNAFAEAKTRLYEKGNQIVAITAVRFEGLVAGDELSVNVKNGGDVGSDAPGTYTELTVALAENEALLTGRDAQWYTLNRRMATRVEIAPEDAVIPYEPNLAQPPQQGPNGELMKVVFDEAFTDGDLGALQNDQKLNTVEKVKNSLLARLQVSAGENGVPNALLYNARIFVSVDNGRSWQEADKNLIEQMGRIRVLLPVPEGTSPATHTYRVAHMFTQQANGHMPGQVEYPEVTVVTDTLGRPSLEFYVTGLSPIMVSWELIPVPQNLPQTGDPSSLMGWLALLGAGAWGLKRRRKY